MKRNAEAGTRTLTALRPPDPESGASTNSATPAHHKVYTGVLFCQDEETAIRESTLPSRASIVLAAGHANGSAIVWTASPGS